MNAKTLEALDCPFCSGPGTIDHGGPHEPNDWCGGCRACDYSLEFRATREEAIAAWNRRASSTARSPVEGLLGRLMALIEREAETFLICDACRHQTDNAMKATDFWHFYQKMRPELQAALTAIHPQAEGETGWRAIADYDAAFGEVLLYFPLEPGRHGDVKLWPMVRVGRPREYPNRRPSHFAALPTPPHPEPGDL